MADDPTIGGPMVDAAAVDVVGSLMASVGSVWGAIPGAVWEGSRDLVRYSTGAATPRFNGIVVLGPDADQEVAAEWLDGLGVAGVPHCILSRESAPTWVAGLASWQRLGQLEEEALMVHDTPEAVTGPDTCAISRVSADCPDEVVLAQRLLTEGFDGVEDLALLMRAEVLRRPGLTAYVARRDGEPCATGLGALHDNTIGVFNIATRPAERRRGHGRSVTARIVADGVAAGARTAYLQASAMGRALYEQMGFRTAEVWPSYYPGT